MSFFPPINIPGMPPARLRPEDEALLQLQQQGVIGEPPPSAERHLAGFRGSDYRTNETREEILARGPDVIMSDEPLAGGLMGYPTRDDQRRMEERALAHQFLTEAGYSTGGESMRNYLDYRRQQRAFELQLGSQMDAIRGAGIMGAEEAVSAASLAGQEAFSQLGDYGAILAQEAHDAAYRDVQEGAELLDLDPEVFQQVGEAEGGVPIVRAPFEEAEPTPGGQRQVTIGGKTYRAATREEYEEAGYTKKKITKTDRGQPGIPQLGDEPAGPPEVITDEFGAYPSRYESLYRKRATAILGGMSKEEAIEAHGDTAERVNEVASALLAPAIEVATFGLAEAHERDKRGLEYLSGGGVEASATASHLAGFIAGPLKGLGALKGATTKGVERLATRTGKEVVAESSAELMKAATRGLTKGTPAHARALARAQAQSTALAQKAGQELLRTKLLNYFGPKITAVGAGVLYEATRPHSPGEEDYLGDLALELERQGATRVEAEAQAAAHLSASKIKGTAIAFGLMEFTGGPLGKITQKTSEKLLRGTRLEPIHAQIAGSMTGAGQGFILAGADPGTRQAMQTWVESGFTDEESWSVVRDGVLISAGVFGLHGFLTTQIALHKQMRERYEDLGRIIPSAERKKIEAAERSLRKRLQALELEKATRDEALSLELRRMGWRTKERADRMDLAVRDYEGLLQELPQETIDAGGAQKQLRRIAARFGLTARDIEARSEKLSLEEVAARWQVEKSALERAAKEPPKDEGALSVEGIAEQEAAKDRAVDAERQRMLDMLDRIIEQEQANPDEFRGETPRKEVAESRLRSFAEREGIEPTAKALYDHMVERHRRTPQPQKGSVLDVLEGRAPAGASKAELGDMAKRLWNVPKSWSRERIERELGERTKAFEEAGKYLERDLKDMRVRELDALATRMGEPRLQGNKQQKAEQLTERMNATRSRQAAELMESIEPTPRTPETFSADFLGRTGQTAFDKNREVREDVRPLISEQLSRLAPGDKLRVGDRVVEFVEQTGQTQARVRDEAGKETVLAESELLSGQVAREGQPTFAEMPRSEYFKRGEAGEYIDPAVPTDKLAAEATRLESASTKFGGDRGGFMDRDVATDTAANMAARLRREIESRQEALEEGTQFRSRWLTASETSTVEAELGRIQGEKEVVGLIGREADTGRVVVREIGQGEPGKVTTGEKELRAGAGDLAEVLGVFHTHPKGEAVSSADSMAAARLREELGVRTYTFDRNNLVEVAPADLQRGVISHSREKPGQPSDHELGLQRALERETDPKRREEIQHQLDVARNDREFVEAVDRVGDRKSHHARRLDAEESNVRDHQEDIMLEAGAKIPWFGKFLSHVLRPDPSIKREAYRRKTLGDPKKGLLRLFRTPQQFIPPAIYDAMRLAASQVQARLDKMSRVVYGRTWFDQVRYGGKGASGTPLAKIAERSDSAHRIAGALDGMTVEQFNASKGVTKIDGKGLVRDHLTERERAAHDQLRTIFEDIRFRMGKHIWRHELARSARQVERIEAELAREGLSPERVDQLKAEVEYHFGRIEQIKQGRNPDTGQKWGLDNYLHRLWEGEVGPNTDGRPALLRQEISKEQWVAGTQRRQGREGYSLDLHRIVDTYIPAMEAKMHMDLILDKTNEVFYGTRDWASGLFDLVQPWHTQNRFMTEQMKLQWQSPEGWRNMASIPRSEVRDQEGRIESVDVRGDRQGERIRVFRTKALARDAGMPEAPTFRDFRVLKGGLAQSLDPKSKDMRTLDYTKGKVRAMFGEREQATGLLKPVAKLTNWLTKYQYHAYLGALYPKAAATNMIFGMNQLIAEVGPQAAWDGISMATKIMVHGRGNSTPATRKYWRVLRQGASHLESFVGYADEGSTGLGRPRTAKQKWAHNLSALSFGPFKGSEALVRASSYLAGYRAAERAGWSREEAHRFARDVVSHTQFDMGAYAAPEITHHPMGYPLIMLRRYALNLLDRHMRGYKGFWQSTAGKALAEQRMNVLEGLVTGKTPGKVKGFLFLRGEERKAPVTAEMIAAQRQLVQDKKSPEHFDNAAFAMRSAIVSGATVFLYRQLFGRDPREQVSAAVGELPILDKMHGIYMSGFGNAISHAPIPGVTGPFEMSPVQAQAAVAFADAAMKRVNGDEFAFADFWDQNQQAVIGRMARDVSRVFAAEPVPGEPGKVGIMRGGQLHYITSKSDLIGNIFLPGRTIEVKEAWDASNRSYAEQQVRKTRRSTWSRLLGSEDPEKIQRGIDMGIEQGFLPDMGSMERRAMLGTTTTNVRRIIASSVDYQGRIMQAARQLPHMGKTEGLQLLFLLGLDDSDWWRLADGTARVQPEAVNALMSAIDKWEAKQ